MVEELHLKPHHLIGLLGDGIKGYDRKHSETVNEVENKFKKLSRKGKIILVSEDQICNTCPRNSHGENFQPNHPAVDKMLPCNPRKGEIATIIDAASEEEIFARTGRKKVITKKMLV